MPRYNILRDRDESFELPDEKAKTKTSAPAQQEPKKAAPSPDTAKKEALVDDFFSDELFPSEPETIEPNLTPPAETDVFDLDSEPIEAPEPEIPDALDDQEFEGPSEFADEHETTYQPREETKAPPVLYTYEEDDKQMGINYKPFMIGLGVVAAAVLIFFVVSNLFFSESTEEAPVTPVETAADIMAREAEEGKQRFLDNLAVANQKKVGAVQVLAGLDPKNVKYSGFLLYGNSLSLEVFAPDRDGLAKFNLLLKNNNRIGQYKIETVNTRPGSKGGVFALYDFNVDAVNVSSSGSTGSGQSVTVENWASSAPKQAGLTVHNSRTVSSRQDNQFRVSRQEYEIRGALQNCLSLLDQMGRATQNVVVHKLSLVPSDQQKMSTSSYIFRLTLDFYL
ncbi:MAG: hypothetical protein E4H13_00785 [Calditrichales bacterium]|nr:MAG: hypothetical protein E4H13_00785 [Calditrichales bacterium]